MIAVFLGFTFSPTPVIKVFGVRPAVAVCVDATVVRMLLVPAIMTLRGRSAWRWPDRRRRRRSTADLPALDRTPARGESPLAGERRRERLS